MSEVIAHIDTTTPRGRKLARELYEHEDVKIENPLPTEMEGKTYSVDEVFDRVRKKIKKHYGVENE